MFLDIAISILLNILKLYIGKLNSLSGDGSLFSAETVRIFVNRVLIATKGQGVHVVTTIGVSLFIFLHIRLKNSINHNLNTTLMHRMLHE